MNSNECQIREKTTALDTYLAHHSSPPPEQVCGLESLRSIESRIRGWQRHTYTCTALQNTESFRDLFVVRITVERKTLQLIGLAYNVFIKL